jgi:hypothetical protein
MTSVTRTCYDEKGVPPKFIQRVAAVLDSLGDTSGIVLV